MAKKKIVAPVEELETPVEEVEVEVEIPENKEEETQVVPSKEKICEFY